MSNLVASPARHTSGGGDQEISFSSVASSFRDPSGSVLHDGKEFLRVVRKSYQPHYDHLLASGLYERLVKEGLLVAHMEIPIPASLDAYKLLRPRQVPFISYPYEWCFSQWRDAALATLRIQELAIEHGMTARDASAFNIQFIEGAPMLIDTLSFEVLDTPQPWAAYGQFCRHFLAPLALMSYRDARLGRLMQVHLDGVPLDLASRLLPWRSRLRPWLLVHLHWHAASERRFKDATRSESRKHAYSLNSLRGLVTSLQSIVQRLAPPQPPKDWAVYYDETVTGGDYVTHKKSVVAAWLQEMKPATVWDLGANTGLFSRIAAGLGSFTVAFDSDPACVEFNYNAARKGGTRKLLPLMLDLTNPTPALGWRHAERMSFDDRTAPDAVLALALVHHLAIGNNVPLLSLAEFFASLSPRLIIEFVPKNDSNARKLLRVREDIFPGYTQQEFENAFAGFFRTEESVRLANSKRVLYRLIRC